MTLGDHLVLSDGAAGFTPGISERRSSATKFMHEDFLGSTTRLTDASQATTDTRQYDAFGNVVSTSGSNPMPFAFAGGWGYQTDSDSGLQLLGHRYYDPSTGRFLTRDPARDGRNWYGYVDNQPVNLLDPEGLQGGPKPPGNNAAADAGREWHKLIQDHYRRRHPGTRIEVKIPGQRMRPNINDVSNRIVIEIKPDRTASIALGKTQALAYADQLGYDDVWIYVYPPGTRPGDFKDPISHVKWLGGHRNLPKF